MKKTLLLFCFLLTLSGGVAGASSINGDYEGNPIVRITAEGKALTVEDVPAVIYRDRTVVPVYLLRQMGFTVTWDAETYTVDVSIAKNEPVAEQKTPLTLEQIQALDKAVALIYALDDNGQRIRQGSGFIINPQGLLITNWHVADENGFRKLEVLLNGQTYYVEKGEYAFQDKEKDIYGVYLEGNDFAYLKVNTELPKVGDISYAIGSPYEKRNTITKGTILSGGSHDNPPIISDGEFFPGQSGGALLNQYGEVEGITEGGSLDYPSYNTSIPMWEVQQLYEQSFNP